MQGRISDLGLLEGIEDRRRGKRDAVIFCPVGDLGQLGAFAKHVRRLGIKGDYDFLFIYRKGLAYQELGLSAIHATEKEPIGTSGCFFAGQALAHSLGYGVLVVADLDATIDSASTLAGMVKLAKEKKIAVVPLSKSPQEKKPAPGYAVMNQWGVVPCGVFGQAGFAIPHLYKGGEDFEFAHRLKKSGRLEIYREGLAEHPKEGLSIYSKMAQRRKYYPYVAGLLKAHVFCARYDALANFRYLLLRTYYSFFADAGGDLELLRVVERPAERKLLDGLDGSRPPFAPVTKREGAKFGRRAGAAKAVSEAAGLLWLLAFKKTAVGDEEVALGVPRATLAFGIAKAVMLLPLRAAQSIFGLLSLKRRFARLTFPIFPESAQKAAQEYLSLLAEG